jgi:hypothetical protein
VCVLDVMIGRCHPRLAQLRDTAQALQGRLQASGGRDAAIRERLRPAGGDHGPAAAVGESRASETVRLEITLAADAEPGMRKLRLSTPLGLTEPLTFVVGQLPEFRESDSEL